jgi:hypothetical protein
VQKGRQGEEEEDQERGVSRKQTILNGGTCCDGLSCSLSSFASLAAHRRHRQMNNLSVKKSRDKKKMEVKDVKGENNLLKEENAKLRGGIHQTQAKFKATFQDICQKVSYELTFQLCNVLLLVKKQLRNTNFLSNGFVA